MENTKLKLKLKPKEEIKEDTNGSSTADKIADQVESIITPQLKSDIEMALDDAWITAIGQATGGTEATDVTNPLLIGEAGCGKSAIVNNWAKKNGITLFTMIASNMDSTDTGGAICAYGDLKSGEAVAKRLSTTEFDDLESKTEHGVPNSVLFLDELNRAPSDVRAPLLQLINAHEIADSRVKGHVRKLEGLLFTVAAINPSDRYLDGTSSFDMALKDRFKPVYVIADPLVLNNYLQGYLDSILEKEKNSSVILPQRLLDILRVTPEEYKQRRITSLENVKKLTNTILTHPDFQFSSSEEIANLDEADDGARVLLPRSFTRLIISISSASKSGSKKDLLNEWDYYCAPEKKADIEGILSNYQEVEDKANSALDGGTSNPRFQGNSNDLLSLIRAAISNGAGKLSPEARKALNDCNSGIANVLHQNNAIELYNYLNNILGVSGKVVGEITQYLLESKFNLLGNLKIIPENCFFKIKLPNLDIPANVEIIEEGAFEDCEIGTIKIENTIKEIYSDIPSSTKVKFNGTEDEWQDVDGIGSLSFEPEFLK